MYKTIIFDLDGTLLDTSRDICKMLNDTLAHFSLPAISLKKTVEYVGNGAKLLVERAIPQSAKCNFNEIYAYYGNHFTECDNELTCLYEGEDQVLKRLKKAGVKLAIVTNKPQNAMEGVYKKHLAKYGFDIIAGNTDEFPLKPDPSLTLDIAKRTGTKINECLFVGDGETDVQTARNAGMDGVAVLWGFRTRTQLENAGAKIFAESYGQLLKIALENR